MDTPGSDLTSQTTYSAQRSKVRCVGIIRLKRGCAAWTLLNVDDDLPAADAVAKARRERALAELHEVADDGGFDFDNLAELDR